MYYVKYFGRFTSNCEKLYVKYMYVLHNIHLVCVNNEMVSCEKTVLK